MRVTIWYENVQELGSAAMDSMPAGNPEQAEQIKRFLDESAKAIKRVHPNGLHMTLKGLVDEMEGVEVTAVTMDMPEFGLPDELLNETDVLIWWAHVAHEQVPDELAEKIRVRVLTGMGFIALHSAHPSKPLQRLLGTSGSLQWREDDFSRVWNVCPTHPIARGIPQSFELPEEEMYGEYFDVPKPDDLIFISWFRGGEALRSGMTWTRGYGKVFYFQPGHETNRSYENPYVRRVIQNAIRWAEPTVTIDGLSCPHAEVAPEARYR